jgi:hypothetical protein
MSIGTLVAEHFWLAIALCLGGVIMFVVFPALAVLALIVATALFLIAHSPKSG